MAYDRIDIMETDTGKIIGHVACDMPDMNELRALREDTNIGVKGRYSLIWCNRHTPLATSAYS